MSATTARWRALGALLRPDAVRWAGLGALVAVGSGLILTGPLIVRERVRVDARLGLEAIEQRVEQRRRELLGRVVEQVERGALRYIDTFSEPSNLCRGVSYRQRRRLDRRLRSGELTLS